MEEIWRPVVGYEGLYEVSNYGNVRSVDHYGYSRHRLKQNRLFKGKEIKPYTKKGTDYKRVSLTKNGVKQKFYVHYLVARAFHEICGEWFDGSTVDHLNGIQNDNRAENLMFKSLKDNLNNPVTIKKRITASIKNLEKANTQEAKNKMIRSKSKPVKCVETGIIYWSRFVASISTGCNPMSIWRCCNGTQHTSGDNKLHWEWA